MEEICLAFTKHVYVKLVNPGGELILNLKNLGTGPLLAISVLHFVAIATKFKCLESSKKIMKKIRKL